jgi:hypothetical protein
MLDTEIDVGSSIAGLCAKIDVWIGSAEKHMEALKKASQKNNNPAPVLVRTVATGIVPAAGPLILGFPLKGPDQGHFWMVRTIAIGGLAVGVVAAGTADVFVSASDIRSLQTTGLAGLGLGDWRDHEAALPSLSFYGSGELALRFNEEIYVVITGGTVGQQYVAALGAIDYREAAIEEGWSI